MESEKQIVLKSCPATIDVKATRRNTVARNVFDACVECPKCYFTFVSAPHGSFVEEIAKRDARNEAELQLKRNCPENKSAHRSILA